MWGGGDYVTTLESFRSCCSTDVASCFELFSCSSLFANKEQPRGEPVALGKCCFSTSENVRDNKRMNSVSHNAPAASAEWAQRDFFFFKYIWLACLLFASQTSFLPKRQDVPGICLILILNTYIDIKKVSINYYKTDFSPSLFVVYCKRRGRFVW